MTGRAGRAPCGTDAGYQQHRLGGETACRRCCDAHALSVAISRAGAHAAHGPVRPAQYVAALAGREPAEALHQSDRARLVAALHHRGLDDAQVAIRTRMTTYTAARIRASLGLPAHQLLHEVRTA